MARCRRATWVGTPRGRIVSTHGERAESEVGIVLAAVSLVAMVVLAAKRRTGQRLL